MVLACVLILFIAIVTFSTLGVAWKTQQRIALQHASDAVAYSRAVKTARAFNYFAYTNRAIASRLTSMVITHSYHTEISSAIGLYHNLGLTWENIAWHEANNWHECDTGWFVTDAICKLARKLLESHCRDDCAVVSIATGRATCYKLLKKGGDYNDTISGLDSKVEDVLGALKLSIAVLQLGQRLVGGELLMDEGMTALSSLGVSSDSSLEAKLSLMNGITAKHSAMASMMNIKNLNKASVTGNLYTLADDKDSRIDMTEVANTARPIWTRNRAPLGVAGLFRPLENKVKDITDGSCSINQIPFVGGTAGIFDSNPASGLMDIIGLNQLLLPQPDSHVEGKGIYSIDTWNVVTCHCEHHSNMVLASSQPWPSVLGARPSILYSAASGEAHRPKQFEFSVNPGSLLADVIAIFVRNLSPHKDADHTLPVNIPLVSSITDIPKGLSTSLRFMRFNAQNNGLLNQPVNYRSLTVDLSRSALGSHMPWDIYDDGKYEGHIFGSNFDGRADVQIVSSKKANSVSKALTYYHHPGDWQEPPNFWNPFWRAKLHPWSKSEFSKVSAATSLENLSLDVAADTMGAVYDENPDIVMDGSGD